MQKNSEKLEPFGILCNLRCKEFGESAFAELRCTACAFETVFLSFFHSRVAGKKSCFFKFGTEFFVSTEEVHVQYRDG